MSGKTREELLAESRARWEEIDRRYKANWKKIREADKEAKKEGRLVGRYIQHAYADGYAIYQIIREYKKTVRIRVCTGIGDDWVLPAWGAESSIPKETAMRFLSWEDTKMELFGKGD